MIEKAFGVVCESNKRKDKQDLSSSWTKNVRIPHLLTFFIAVMPKFGPKIITQNSNPSFLGGVEKTSGSE